MNIKRDIISSKPEFVLYKNIKNSYFKEIKDINSDIHTEFCIYYLNDILKRLDLAFQSIRDQQEQDIFGIYIEFICDIRDILHDFQYVGYVNEILYDDNYIDENYDVLLSLCNYSLILYGQIILELKRYLSSKNIIYFKYDYIDDKVQNIFISYFNRILGYKTSQYYCQLVSSFFQTIKDKIDGCC